MSRNLDELTVAELERLASPPINDADRALAVAELRRRYFNLPVVDSDDAVRETARDEANAAAAALNRLEEPVGELERHARDSRAAIHDRPFPDGLPPFTRTAERLEEYDVEVPVCHLLEPDGSALCGAGLVLGIPFGADVDVTASPCVSGCGRHRCDACVEALEELDG